MKKTVTVTQEIEIEYDESKLTDPKFVKEFNEYICEMDGVDDHLKHIATCEARGIIGFDSFVEGYGDLKKFGISLTQVYCEAEIED